MLVTQSSPTLCDPVDGSSSGSSVHWILQARVLEWDAIAFSDIHTTKFKIITNKDLPYSTGNYLIFFNNLNGMGFPGGSDGKESAWSAGDPGLILGSGRSLGGGHGHPLQYSCLENPMDRGAWWATLHGVAKSRTRLSNFTFTFTFRTQ